jgi:hypothetical protein
MRWLSLGLVMVLSIFSRTSWADGADDEAQARFKAGVTFATQGKWDNARLAFLQAYTVIPTSVDLLWNLAYAEFKSGHVLEALEHFKKYERDPRAEPGRIAALPKLREQAYQKVGRLKVQAPSGTTVSIDDKASEWVEPIDLQPGDHKISAKLGDQVKEQSFSINAGQVLQLPFTFAEEAHSVPATPPSGLGPVDQPPPPKTRYWVSGGIALGAVAAASVGLGFGFTANSEKDAIEQRRRSMGGSCDPNTPMCEDTQHTHVDLARGFLIGSAVLASTAVVTFLVWPRANATVSMTPTALTFSTRF